MSTRFHVNPLTMPRKGSSNISAPDLLKLLESKGRSGFLRKKHITSITRTVKWRLRFVILSHSALYVYETEMSKTPEMSIPLLGYIAVERETTTTCAWVFSLVPGVSSLPRKSFACSKDEERREWMQEIKHHLYMANNINTNDTATTSKFTDKMKLAEHLTPEERMYVQLEFPIIPPEGGKVDDEVDEGNNDVDDDDDDDDNDDDKFEEEDDDSQNVSVKRFVSRSSSTKNVKDQVQCHARGHTHNLPNDASDETMPPRYSALVGGVELEYQNIGSSAPMANEIGLEKACTISDEKTSKDREACIEMLKKTNRIGTYLIRRSRTQEYKVLSILSQDFTVKEYRIEEAYGLFHFFHDASHEFPTIQSLLDFYSHYKPVPSLGTFLGWGIHDCGEEGAQMYEETC